ncbi:hypothetical protein BDF14DRAFT_821374 [Spinellus fusiger]|nr:hypothetical protein BDF14DRAFT_821374 [Spinellus fusiger]
MSTNQCLFLHTGPSFITVCRFFKTNSCHNGDDCAYSHDLSLEPCRFFHVKGICESGASCPFSHEPLTPDFRRRLHAMTGPCRFFHFKGYCNDGDQCLFSHTEITDEQRVELESTLELCRHYHSTGICKKGDDCFYLHGEASQEARALFLKNNAEKLAKTHAIVPQE